MREFQNVHLKSQRSNPIDEEEQDEVVAEGKMNGGGGGAPARRTGSNSSCGSSVSVDSDGLIVPRKLHNPCLDSAEVQNLNREIKWNKRT